MGISIAYSTWFIPLILVLAGGISFIFYRKDDRLKEFSKPLTWFLMVLRFLMVSILLFLVLNPFVKTITNEIEKPIMVIGIDNSESMTNWGDSLQRQQWVTSLNDLKQSLSQDYEVEMVQFGSAVAPLQSPKFNQKTTDFSAFARNIASLYTNRNLSGVITLSDGLVNRGSAPEFAFKGLTVPVHCVGVGDTSSFPDVAIAKLRNNKLAYLDNDFPVEVTISGEKAKGRKILVSIVKNGKKLKDQQILFSNNNDLKTVLFTLPAEAEGVQKYVVRASTIENEKVIENNTQSFYIEVLNAKQRILIIGHAPHPDLGSLKNALEKNVNNSIIVSLVSELEQKVEDFNLVIAHQIPTADNQSISFVKSLIDQKINTLFVLGNNTNLTALNSLIKGFSVQSKPGNIQEVGPYFNEQFNAFQLEPDFKDALNWYTPLLVPFGNYQLSKNFQTVLFQKIGPVPTDKPLLSFTNVGDLKMGFLFGEGIWRWRIKHFQKVKDHQAIDQFIQKIAQFLVAKEDKSRFRVTADNAVFENESVTFNAELYDETYTLTTSTDVQVYLKDNEGIEYDYDMLKGGETFGLNISGLPPSTYSYTAKTLLGGDKFSKSGTFTVKALDLEKNAAKADYNLLVNLSKSTGGAFTTIDQLNTLTENLIGENKASAISYERSSIFNLINLKWIFFVLLAFVSIEWFIRKQNGAY